MKLPQRIVDNLNPEYVNAVFKLLNSLSDSRLNDNNLFKFKICLSGYDGDFDNQEERDTAISTLNCSYNHLSALQKKIVLRTLERGQINYNVNTYLDLYLKEIDALIAKG